MPATASATAHIDIEKPWRDPKTGQTMSHLEWARTIAAAVARKKGFVAGGREQEELEAFAMEIVWLNSTRFDLSKLPEGGDADGLFRGWTHMRLQPDLDKEVRRLRGGGMIKGGHSPATERIRPGGLPTRITDSGDEEVMIEDYRGGPDE